MNTRCDEYITDNVAMATLSKYYHESREPKLFGSIGSTFTILKNIDVSFLTTYSIGGWVYDGLYNGSMYVQYAGNNWHKTPNAAGRSRVTRPTCRCSKWAARTPRPATR